VTGRFVERALPWIAMALYACALLSKTVTATLPVALAVVLWWKRRYSWSVDTPVLGAMLVAGAAMGKLTSVLEQYRIGAVGEPWSLTLLERALIAGRAFWFYLGKLAWPVDLAFVYPRWEIDVTAPAQLAWPAAAVAVLFVAFRCRRRLGDGPWVALVLFTVTVAPALGFFDVYPHRYSFVADHFQYLASIGPLALSAAALASLRGRRGEGAALRALATAGVVAAPVVLGILTLLQASAYRDPETLWRRSLETNPHAPMASYNLAVLLQERGESDEAAVRYREALKDDPELVDAHVNLANLLAGRGELDSAIEHYREALRIRPGLANAHYNLALALEGRGDPHGALRHYRMAIAIRPDFAEAHNNLAIVLYETGRYEEAWESLRRARELGLTPHSSLLEEVRRRLGESRVGP
jgi:tetratricopeptide (TPR) repeat protein